MIRCFISNLPHVMKLSGLLTFALLISSLIVFAQNRNKMRFEISGGYNVPISKNFSELYKSGLGAEVSLAYKINHVQLLASIGIINFLSETYEDEYLAYETPSILTLTPGIGIQYFITPNVFVRIGSGISRYLDTSGYFVYKFEGNVGYLYKRISISNKLEIWSRNGSLAFTGLRIGYYL